ncbi:hypothetical protein ACU4GG_04550 [Streptomyces nojiriensis]
MFAQQAAAPGVKAMFSLPLGSGERDRDRNIEAFVSLTDVTADDLAPVLLRRLIDHSVRLTGMDAAGVMLANARGRLRPVAATSDLVEVTEMFQAQIARGPCVDAYATGEPVHAERLAGPRGAPAGLHAARRRRRLPGGPRTAPAGPRPAGRRPEPAGPRPNPLTETVLETHEI